MIKIYTGDHLTRTVPLCKSKNSEILGHIILIIILLHLYPFLIGSSLPNNFASPTDFDQMWKIFSDILKNDVRFTDSWLKWWTGRHSEYRMQRLWEDLLLDLRLCHRPLALRGQVTSAFSKTMTWNLVDEKKITERLKIILHPKFER